MDKKLIKLSTTSQQIVIWILIYIYFYCWMCLLKTIHFPKTSVESMCLISVSGFVYNLPIDLEKKYEDSHNFYSLFMIEIDQKIVISITFCSTHQEISLHFPMRTWLETIAWGPPNWGPLKPLGNICLRCSKGFRFSRTTERLIAEVIPVWYRWRNLFRILLNRTEIRLYSPFSDWFRTQQNSVIVPNQSKSGKYTRITVWFNNIPKIVSATKFIVNFYE